MEKKELIAILTDDNKMVIDSRDIAEKIEMRHHNLLRNIDKYIEVIIEIEKDFNEYFIESSYKDSIGRTCKCYLVTKKGCEVIAHKLPSDRGIAFTVEYVDVFEKMKEKVSLQNKPVQLPDFTNPAEAARAWADQYEGRERAEKQVQILKPDAEYTQNVLKSKSLVNISTIAEDWGLTGAALNKVLGKLKVQYRFQGKNQWHLYSQYKGKGYAQFSTIVKQTPNGTYSITYLNWTQNGKRFICDLLQSKGFKPVSEWTDTKTEIANLRKLLKQFEVKGGILKKTEENA